MAILSQGLVLLLAGMSIVFAFLAVLVLVMSVSSKIIPKFNHILPDPAPKKRAVKSATTSDEIEIAITIAVATAAQTA